MRRRISSKQREDIVQRVSPTLDLGAPGSACVGYSASVIFGRFALRPCMLPQRRLLDQVGVLFGQRRWHVWRVEGLGVVHRKYATALASMRVAHLAQPPALVDLLQNGDDVARLEGQVFFMVAGEIIQGLPQLEALGFCG